MNKLSTLWVLVAMLGASALSYANDNAHLSTQGQLFIQLQQMQKEITALRGMLEEQQNQIRLLSQESLERYQQLDKRLSHTVLAEQSVPAANDNAVPLLEAQATPELTAELGNPEKEQEYYDAAFNLVRTREFDTAKQAFAAFLRRYPNGQYTANAHYWLGEINLAQENYQSAGKAFATVIQSWPEHSKVPDSMYKLADVEQRMGQIEQAKMLFKQVIEQHPRSSAAKLAQQELQRL